MVFILLASLLFIILLGVPVILALALVGAIGIASVDQLVLALFPQKMFAQINSFSLLALPYFILAGSIMSAGGLGKHLIDFAGSLVGHLRAGLAHTSVVASMAFAGVSGSSTADASAISSLMIPTMKEQGYKAGFSAALIACAGTIGAIIPPSMVMVIYGAMAQVSIGQLFLAGIIPGLLVALFLMATVVLYSFRPNFPELRATSGSFSSSRVIGSIVRVWPALLVPVIIVGGILGGIFTATEAGIFACVYALLISVFFYRSITFKDIVTILVDAAVTTAMVSGVIAVAGAFGWLLAYLEFNKQLLTLLTSVSADPIIIMLLLAFIMLILTMFVEALAVLVIFTPVAVHVGSLLGIDPLQMGMIMVMANQIGSTTPPVAVLLFVTTSIAKTTFDETMKYVWLFIVAEIIVLLLVIFFEPISTWIPSVLMSG